MDKSLQDLKTKITYINKQQNRVIEAIKTFEEPTNNSTQNNCTVLNKLTKYTEELRKLNAELSKVEEDFKDVITGMEMLAGNAAKENKSAKSVIEFYERELGIEKVEAGEKSFDVEEVVWEPKELNREEYYEGNTIHDEIDALLALPRPTIGKTDMFDFK